MYFIVSLQMMLASNTNITHFHTKTYYFFLPTEFCTASAGERSAPKMFPNRNNSTTGEHQTPHLCHNRHSTPAWEQSLLLLFPGTRIDAKRMAVCIKEKSDPTGSLFYHIVCVRCVLILQVSLVCRKINQSVAAEVEQKHLFPSLFFGFKGLTDGCCNCVG